MATSFAFVTAGNASGKPGWSACTVARPAPAADDHAALAREPHIDVLWRLSTRPWARARTALVRSSVPSVLAWLETTLLAATAFGMVVLTVVALAA